MIEMFKTWVLLIMRNVSGKTCRENKNTHLMFNDFFENRSIYQIMWKNIVEPERPQMTIWHMRIACWMPKATNTHSQYVLLIAFPLQQWLHEPRCYVIRTLSVLFLLTILVFLVRLLLHCLVSHCSAFIARKLSLHQFEPDCRY